MVGNITGEDTEVLEVKFVPCRTPMATSRTS